MVLAVHSDTDECDSQTTRTVSRPDMPRHMPRLYVNVVMLFHMCTLGAAVGSAPHPAICSCSCTLPLTPHPLGCPTGAGPDGGPGYPWGGRHQGACGVRSVRRGQCRDYVTRHRFGATSSQNPSTLAAQHHSTWLVCRATAFAGYQRAIGQYMARHFTSDRGLYSLFQ